MKLRVLQKLKLNVSAMSFLLIFTVLLNIIIFTSATYAAEMSFSVQAVIPDNQIDKTQSYFDLKMSPSQQQELEVEMRNDTDKDVTIEVGANNATTNDNGIVDYNSPNKEKDNTLEVGFADIANVDTEVTIPANSKQMLKIQLKMPGRAFDGVILGGIYFKEKETSELENENNESQVINKYAYTIGVKLTETETELKPELVLNSVEAGQVNYRNMIKANIQNKEAAIITDLTIEGKVYLKGKSKILYQQKKEGLRMAPNSNFNYAISTNNKEFKSGTYLFKGEASTNEQKWIFEKEFTIEGAKAKELNKEAVQVEKDYFWIYLAIGCTLVLLLIFVIVYLVMKIKKQKSSKVK